ncbi:dihydrofolate reductase [Halalkalibacillus sediminis]|uniref:Dihydrofolate reductase n=1 Tax=Halalkalibacillus sediminis TaxID=2018042 RepID=A0A2I0QWT6_9BACI|nr:dihydrofolate reductase [Halalkalibacillus sediminis]PKR78802.1 dihydrofolate reductase [Halalkalibacillus sediminis]
MISLIWAMDQHRVIGSENGMPWHLPNDLKFFKRVTSGSPVIMGRKTFESIGRPLPKRENIILTRDKDFKVDGCEIVHSWKELDPYFQRNEEVFIIGGAQLFEIALPQADRLYMSQIHESFDGDTFFPQFDLGDWRLIEEEEGVVDEKNEHEHTFYIFERK